MFVFVQDASEPIASSDPEMGYLVWVGERGGQWVQRSGVGKALVRPVAFVEAFEFVQGVHQIWLVPDQGPVQQFAAARPDPAFHDGVHAGCLDAAEHDLDTSVGKDAVEQRGELAVPVARRTRGQLLRHARHAAQVKGARSPVRG